MKAATFPCAYSDRGIEHLRPKNPRRIGNAYYGRTYVLVKWLGNLSFASYHRSFIKPLDQIPKNKSMVSRNESSENDR